MKKHLFYLLALIFLFASCDESQRKERSHEKEEETTEFTSKTHEAFFKNLAKLCGNTYQGKEIYRSHHGESVAELDLIMHVTVCEEDKIYIPFHIGDDKSRTWMFLVEDGRLRLRHDHRYDDGTPHDETLYGGYADDTGSEFVQNFPADEYSAKLIEDGGGNLWTITLSEDLSTYTYRLERDGEKRWRVDFDLTKPL